MLLYMDSFALSEHTQAGLPTSCCLMSGPSLSYRSMEVEEDGVEEVVVVVVVGVVVEEGWVERLG